MTLLPCFSAAGAQEAAFAKSAGSRASRFWAVTAFILVLSVCYVPKSTHAQLEVPDNSDNITLPVVQLLYDGHWLPVRPCSLTFLPFLVFVTSRALLLFVLDVQSNA